MTSDDVYEQWKTQRLAVEVPSDLEAKVISSVDDWRSQNGNVARPTQSGLLDRPAWATVAMVAASIIGIMRVTFALYVGIL